MSRIPPVLTLVIGLCITVTATAQQPTERERQLEELVRKLTERIDKLESRLDALEPGEDEAVTEERVQQLEATVHQIQEDRPPAADSQEWAELKKWVRDSGSLRPYWKDGLRLDNKEGSIKLKIGGRLQNDFSLFCEDGDVEENIGADFEDGTEFRRARLYFSGTIDNDIEFKVQYDFAGGDADFKDAYLGLKHVPFVGNIRVGHFKEPFSLEELTSSNYITFLERSLVNTFAPGRNTGVMVFDTLMGKRMTWAAGFFRQTDSFGDGTGGRDYNATARLTALPVYEDEGKTFVHLGVAYTHQNYEDETLRIRARPEAHLSPRLVDTGTFAAAYGDLIGTEAAMVLGPFSVQAEYVHSFIESRDRWIADPNFCAASLQASYFLTGEHRPYKRSTGTFDRVRPLRNFREDGGMGAWEIATRISYLNLNDSGVRGGRLTDWSLGLNWYLNPNVRTMWNYVYANPSDGGAISAFLWRLQVAF